MKTSFTNANKENTRRRVAPPIPLERPEIRKLEKGEYQSYKLRNDPTNKNSPTYELSIPYFATGSPEEWLRFLKNLTKVFTGQNVTDGPGKYTVMKRLLEGEALSVFELAETECGTQTNNNFRACINDVTKHVFPARALQSQKRFMRRFLRKPITLKTRDYVA